MKKYIKANGQTLACIDQGEGSPLILLHAFALGKWMWEEQVSFFSGKRRVISFDWRGFGESSPVEGTITMEDLADDLMSVISFLELDSFDLCGLSMGGYAAFAFARKYPQEFASRVHRLILADTKATIENDAGRLARLEMAALAENSGSKAIADISVPKWLSDKTKTSRPEVMEKVSAEISRTSNFAIAAAQRGMAQRADSTEILCRISCPSLLIVGSDDVLTPPEEARTMAHHLSVSTLEIIEGAGHLSNLESPEDFNAIVGKWLEQ